jgi:hypothetical protein
MHHATKELATNRWAKSRAMSQRKPCYAALSRPAPATSDRRPFIQLHNKRYPTEMEPNEAKRHQDLSQLANVDFLSHSGKGISFTPASRLGPYPPSLAATEPAQFNLSLARRLVGLVAVQLPSPAPAVAANTAPVRPFGLAVGSIGAALERALSQIDGIRLVLRSRSWNEWKNGSYRFGNCHYRKSTVNVAIACNNLQLSSVWLRC